ncbi:MAG: hypothetical protein K2L81_06895, partial [Muribaculaceae bacterium]|nr:hypothetical protein [Muribaculaceae bacterium]
TEIRLFGNDYINFANYGKPGTPILVTGKFSRRFAKSEVQFNITSIALLESVRGKMLKGVVVNLPVDKINNQTLDLIDEHCKSSTQNCGTLSFRVYDPKINRTVELPSNVFVPINRQLVTMLEDLDLSFNVVRN